MISFALFHNIYIYIPFAKSIFVQDFISGAFANWTEAEIVAIEDQMIEKLEELAKIETHKQTYPVSRTEFG